MWQTLTPKYPLLGGPYDGAETEFVGDRIPAQDGYAYHWRRGRYVWHPYRTCSCGAEVLIPPTEPCPLCGDIVTP